MFVYNLTIKTTWAIADKWLAWQREENIPEVMATKLFDDYKIYRILEQDDHDGPTFTIQYFTSSEKKYKLYLDSFASSLRKKAFEKWGDQFIAHRTIMELVN
jgi:hypothetical protein